MTLDWESIFENFYLLEEAGQQVVSVVLSDKLSQNIMGNDMML